MYSAHAKQRVTTAIAGLLIAGAGLLTATSAAAADPRPGAGADSGTAAAAAAPAQGSAPAGGSSAATPTSAAPTSATPTSAASTSAIPTSAAKPAAEPKGRVTSRLPLSIRAKATSNSAYLGAFQPNAVIYLHCKVVGQNVGGNNRWYLLGNGHPGYVAARYVDNLSAVPWCN